MRRIQSQRGSALLIITILVVVLAGLAGAFLTTTWTEHQATMFTEAEIQCRQAAASGLDRARRLLFEIRDKGDKWNDALSRTHYLIMQSGYTTGDSSLPQYSPGGSSYYQDSVARSMAQPASTATSVPPELFFGQSFVNGDVVYNAILADDGDGDGDPVQDKNDQVIVFVTVATPAQVEPGTARRILGVYRAVVYYLPPNFVPNYAIIVNGNLHMGGSPSIQGLMGSVHTNGDLDINGGTNMVISTQGSATGNIVLTGTPPTPSGGWAPNAAPVPIPRIDPKEHIDKATYILANDGNIYNNTTSPRTLIGSGTWAGFTWDSKTNTWNKKNNTVPPPGAIYIDGSVEINGGGTAATPWRTTLLVNGNIGMEGNPFLVPYLPGVSMMAFGDIRLRGTPASFPDVNGLIATHEQIDISGTPRFRGSVLAEDVGDAFDLVTTSSRAGTEDFLDITGNFSLTYDGDLSTFLVAGGTSVAIRSWDRYR